MIIREKYEAERRRIAEVCARVASPIAFPFWEENLMECADDIEKAIKYHLKFADAILLSNIKAGILTETFPVVYTPVEVAKPDILVPVIAIIEEEDNEIAICLYEKNEGFYLSYDVTYKPKVSGWCYIPEGLFSMKSPL